MATKNVRWKCPICEDGLLAPSRPRLDDVRRYCLPCSSETGKLVQRFSPAMERQRAEAKVKRKAKKTRKRQTVTRRKEKTAPVRQAKARLAKYGKAGQYNFDITKEATRLWKLLEPYHKGRRLPTIDVDTDGIRVDEQGRALIPLRGRLGYAYIDRHRIWLRAGVSWQTLAHELVHIAVGTRHGNKNHKAHDKVFYDALRDLAQRRFKVRISFFEVTRYGYDVDHLIERQLHELGAWSVFEKKAKTS